MRLSRSEADDIRQKLDADSRLVAVPTDLVSAAELIAVHGVSKERVRILACILLADIPESFLLLDIDDYAALARTEEAHIRDGDYDSREQNTT